MIDYTPTTDAVRAAYVRNRRRPFTDPEDHRAEFQRWLAAHDAALRAEWEAERGQSRGYPDDEPGALKDIIVKWISGEDESERMQSARIIARDILAHGYRAFEEEA